MFTYELPLIRRTESSTSTDTSLDVVNVLLFDLEIEDAVTISKKLKGPGQDFYRGSTYETTVFDMLLVSCARKILSLRDISEGCDDLVKFWLIPIVTKVTILQDNSEKVINECNQNTSIAKLF